MASPAAILQVLVNADTQQAAARLTEFDAKVRTVQRQAARGIETQLGGRFDRQAFEAYDAYTTRAARRAADREAFRVQLGANFNYRAFQAYERAVDQAERQAARLKASQRSLSDRFFTGSRGGGSEERSFARGTVRGAVGRGAGFLGGGLAGGLLGYVSAQGIRSSIESTTQMVRQAEVLSHYTGISRQNALSLEAVSNALGVSSRGLGQGFRTLATAANTALTQPTKASTAAFRELGLSQADVKAHSRDLGALFGMVADRLNRLPQGTERTALAAKLLGRNWQQLAPLIEQGSRGIAEQTRQAQALGVTLGGDPVRNIAKLHEAEVRLQIAQEGLSFQFTEHVAPALIKVTTGTIQLAERVRRDLTPVFHELSPAVKDTAHWLEQNRGIVEGLVGALVGLKVVRTVGGWFGGLANDAKATWGVMQRVGGLVTGQGGAWERLTGVFRGQQSETQQLTGAMNELAASLERVGLAQKGVAGSTAAADTALGAEATAGAGAGAGAAAGTAGFGFAGAAALPLALYMAGVGRTSPGGLQGSAGRQAAGLASVLGPIGQSYVTRTSSGASSNPYVMARFGDVGASYAVRQVNAPDTLRQLRALQTGLRGVTSASQLSGGQLDHYREVVERLIHQPDLTAKQRRGLTQLEAQLNPTTVAFRRATAQWSSTFQGFDTTTGNASRNFRNQLAQDSHEISQNWTRGTRQWTRQVKALTASAWQEIGQLSAQGVSGVAQDIQALVAMLDQAQITSTRAGQKWLGAVQGNLASMGLGKALAAAHGHLPGGGAGGASSPGGAAWDIPTHHHHHHRHTHRHVAGTRRHAAALSTAAGAAAGANVAGGQFQSPSQSTALQIQFQEIANQLQAAQNAQNVPAQDRALNREIRLDRRALGLDQARMRGIVRQLHGAMSKARRSQLMADKLQLLQDMGSLRNDIGSAMSSLQNVAGSSTGQFDLAPAGMGVTTPTIYDVRSAASGQRAVEHHVHVTVHAPIRVEASHNADQIVARVYDEFEREVGSQLHARLQAAGMRGT